LDLSSHPFRQHIPVPHQEQRPCFSAQFFRQNVPALSRPGYVAGSQNAVCPCPLFQYHYTKGQHAKRRQSTSD
jgi:hypothetical protein